MLDSARAAAQNQPKHAAAYDRSHSIAPRTIHLHVLWGVRCTMSFWTKLSDLSQSRISAAVKEGDLERVKALLKGKPDLVFTKDDAGWTPLHYAAHWGWKEVAELLMANKAEVNAQTTDGLNPLHIAAAQGYREVAELLLANKAE